MAGHVLLRDDEQQLRALLPWLSTLANRRALVPGKCGCVPGCVREGCTFCCTELRSGALVVLQDDELVEGVLYYQERKIPRHSDLPGM